MNHRTQTEQLGALDRTANCPLYQQIADLLTSAIQQRRYQHGDRLPSETALAAHFGVARMTVRHAIQLLLRSGLASAEHGRRGVFVAGPDHAGSPTRHLSPDDLLALVAVVEHINGHVLTTEQYSALQSVYRAARARHKGGQGRQGGPKALSK